MSITGYPMVRAHVTRVPLVSLCKWLKKKFLTLQLPNEYDFIQKHSLPLPTPLSSVKSSSFFKYNEEIKNLSLSAKYPQSCMIPPQWQISHRSHNFRAEGLWLPLVGGWRNLWKTVGPPIFESELVSLCGEPQIVTFPFDLGFLLTAGVLVRKGETY